ncbi:hypothetical protein PO909_013090 [Leuciscus waleckii]
MLTSSRRSSNLHQRVDLLAPPPASDPLNCRLHLGSSHPRFHQTPSAFRLYWVPSSHLLPLGQSSHHLRHGLADLPLRSIPPPLWLQQAPPFLWVCLSPPSHRHHLSPRAVWLLSQALVIRASPRLPVPSDPLAPPLSVSPS